MNYSNSSQNTFHYVLVYGTLGPFSVVNSITLLLSIGWIIYIYGKIIKSYRLWKHYEKTYKYQTQYRDPIRFHRNAHIRNVLILIFLILEVSTILFMLIDGIYAELVVKTKRVEFTDNCWIEEATWLSAKFIPQYTFFHITEAGWQAMAITELSIYNLIFIVLIQTYSHNHNEKSHFRKLAVFYIPLQAVLLLALNTYSKTILFGKLLFAILLQLHIIFNMWFSKTLWSRLKRHQIDMSYFADTASREYKTFVRVTERYRIVQISNILLLQCISITIIIFTVVNVFGGTILLNPCWIEQVYGIQLPRLRNAINTRVFRDISYLVIILRDWSVMIYYIYIIVITIGIAAAYVKSKKVKKSKFSGYSELTTPLCQGTNRFALI